MEKVAEFNGRPEPRIQSPLHNEDAQTTKLLQSPANSYFTYNRVPWKLNVRKEVSRTPCQAINYYGFTPGNNVILSSARMYYVSGVYAQRSHVQPVSVAFNILSNSQRYVQQVPFSSRQNIGRRTRGDVRRMYTETLHCSWSEVTIGKIVNVPRLFFILL